jgi:pyruvate/2-oxoglutarate dehydrogenase complex dihydrolipoamide dehydrogenase (E3) component
MDNPKQIVVVGGGPAGLQAAVAAAGAGRRVVLVTDSPPGGRAAWQTLLPSKIWLAARDTGRVPTLADLQVRCEQVASTWQRQLLDELDRAGVEIRLGTACFLSPHELQVTPQDGGSPETLYGDSVILATGAVPFLPPGLQPDGERIFSPQMIWQMPRLPEDMVVIGAGGPATEYVDVFSRLGVQVTWVTGPVSVLSAFPPDAGHFITGVMQRRGVRVIAGMLAREIEWVETDGQPCVRVLTVSGAAYPAEMAFVAIGMRPDLERLNLPAAGLKAGSSGGLAVDPYGRTAVEHIYLAGDAASPLSANISIAQGRLAGRHAAGLQVEPLHSDQAVMAIYTDPQVAMVGRMSDRNTPVQKVRLPFSASLRAHLMPASRQTDDMGFLEIAYDSGRRVVGGFAVCPEAAELLTPLAVAIRAGMTIDALAAVYPAHPTFSELAILAARSVK